MNRVRRCDGCSSLGRALPGRLPVADAAAAAAARPDVSAPDESGYVAPAGHRGAAGRGHRVESQQRSDRRPGHRRRLALRLHDSRRSRRRHRALVHPGLRRVASSVRSSRCRRSARLRERASSDRAQRYAPAVARAMRERRDRWSASSSAWAARSASSLGELAQQDRSRSRSRCARVRISPGRASMPVGPPDR